VAGTFAQRAAIGERAWRFWHRLAARVGDLVARFSGRRPRVLLLADRRGWAFDVTIRACLPELRRRFRPVVRYAAAHPPIDARRFDAAVVFFWGETCLRTSGMPWWTTAKNLASHRYVDPGPYGPCTPREATLRHMRDAGTLLAWSRRLERDFAEAVEPGRCLRIRHGADTGRFRPCPPRTGGLVVGWAGNRGDPVKRFDELAPPSCVGIAELRVAGGELDGDAMPAFYDAIDVLLVTSRHEGKPGPLYEALTSGCFVVACDVGTVPELIVERDNGIVVAEPTVAAYRAALSWCQQNLERIRAARGEIARRFAAAHSWRDAAAEIAGRIDALVRAGAEPRFRNDDVGWDTPLERFAEFCRAFRERGFSQIHAVTLNGRVCNFATHAGASCTYPGHANLGSLPNALIRELSAGMRFADRADLVAALAEGEDDIALHGLYHTDYARMTLQEQRDDIARGLAELDRLFPRKVVRTFVPPFNRFNADTAAACREHGLTLLASDGIHLEERILDAPAVPGAVYRYHHHRFYPESTARFYPTDMGTLCAALSRLSAGFDALRAGR
jgi:glycosyltransferase involved in cell wall biosynthesis